MSEGANGQDEAGPDDSGPIVLPDNAECRNCHYSQLLPVRDPRSGTAIVGQHQRICRRFPPSPVILSVQGGPPGQVGMFPNVAEDTWCFEFDEREGGEVIPTAF